MAPGLCTEPVSHSTGVRGQCLGHGLTTGFSSTPCRPAARSPRELWSLRLPTGSVLGVAGTGAAVLSRAGWVWGTLSCLILVGPGRIVPVFVLVVPPPACPGLIRPRTSAGRTLALAGWFVSVAFGDMLVAGAFGAAITGLGDEGGLWTGPCPHRRTSGPHWEKQV